MLEVGLQNLEIHEGVLYAWIGSLQWSALSNAFLFNDGGAGNMMNHNIRVKFEVTI